MSVSIRDNRRRGGRAGGSVPHQVKAARRVRREAEGIELLEADRAAIEASRGTGPRGEGQRLGWSPGEVIARILGRLRQSEGG